MTSSAIKQIEGQLEKVVIHLTWYDVAGKPKHGTAFFVTAEGVALTAFHNIEDTLVANPGGPLMGRWQGQDLRFRWKLPEAEQAQWQKETEIAVLETEDVPIGITTVDAGFLDPKVDDSARNRHWSSGRVVVAGFGKGQGYNLAAGDGNMVADPLSTVAFDDKRCRALTFHNTLAPSGVDHAPGLSGSPVYSPADAAIIGITIAARIEMHAAELGPLYSNWPGSLSFLKKLKLRPDPPPAAPVKRTLLGVWLALVLAVAVGWMWWRQTRHIIPQDLSADVLRLDTGVSEPVKENSTFKIGERVRFHLISPRDGHLYVVDQEIVAGHNGDPFIIFPTLLTGVGRNHVKAGDPVDFPSEDDIPSYIAARSDNPGYDGDLLTLLIFPNPLPVMLERNPIPLDPTLVSLDGMKPRRFTQPFAPPGDALAIRRIRLRVTK